MMASHSMSLSLLLLVVFVFSGVALSGDTSTKRGGTQLEGAEVIASDSVSGDFALGEERYQQSCVNCHGAAGKGVASYPKISGNEIDYTISRLETYRKGEKVGPNSSLMIMMAKPLTDEEILDLAVYLKDAMN